MQPSRISADRRGRPSWPIANAPAKVVEFATVDAASGTMAMGAAEAAFQAINTNLSSLVDQNQRLSHQQEQTTQHFLTLLSRLWIGLFAAVVLLICGLARSLLRSIAHPVQRSIQILSTGTAEVADGRARPEHHQPSLAEGASEQAASIQGVVLSAQYSRDWRNRGPDSAGRSVGRRGLDGFPRTMPGD